MAADNEPAEAALRANTLRIDRRRRWRERLPVPTHAGAAAARGRSCSTAPFDAPRRARVASGGLFMPQSRAAMAVARVARPAARRARARPVRRARRQDHPPRRADGRRGRDRRRRAPPRPRRRRSAHRRADGRDAASRSAPATPPQPHEPAPYDRVLVDPPCSDLGTLASPPRRALAQDAGAARASSPRSRPRSSTPAPARCGPAARSSTRPARSRPPRTSASIDAFLADRQDFEADDLRAGAVPVWEHPTVPQLPADAPAPRRHGRLLHRPAAQARRCASDARRRPRAASARPATSRGCARPTSRAATAA